MEIIIVLKVLLIIKILILNYIVLKFAYRYFRIAQWIERLSSKQNVESSNLSAGTTSRAARQTAFYWHLTAGNKGAAEKKLELLLGKQVTESVQPGYYYNSRYWYSAQQLKLQQEYNRLCMQRQLYTHRVPEQEAKKWYESQRDRIYSQYMAGFLNTEWMRKELDRVFEEYKRMVGYGMDQERARPSIAAISTTAYSGHPADYGPPRIRSLSEQA